MFKALRLIIGAVLSIVAIFLTGACGQVTDASIFTEDENGDNSGGFSTSERSGSGGSASIREGKYSFFTSGLNVECSDGSNDILSGSSLQMKVEVSSGYMRMYQSQESSTASQEQVESSGVRVISSTIPSGPISSSGDFSLSSSALFEDPTYGYMRARYITKGKFSGTSWSGTYEYSIIFEDLGFTCTYETTFTGALVN